MMKKFKKVLAYVCALAVICAAGGVMHTTQAEAIDPEISNVMSIDMEIMEFVPSDEEAQEELLEEEVLPAEEPAEEPTEEPAEEPEEEAADSLFAQVDDDDEEAEEESDEAAPAFTVEVRIVDPQKMYFEGDVIRIESTITGECAQPTYQWQVLRAEDPEQKWVDIDGATASYYEFALSPENFADSYRVNVVDAAAK